MSLYTLTAPTPRVLVLTARMGAGHDRVATELVRRLRARGAEARILDVWDLQPAGLGRLVVALYRFLVRRLPGGYERIYRIWLKPPPSRRRAPLSPVTRLAGRRLGRAAEEMQADLVVSTFHLATQVLGALRRSGALRTKTASICVDFAAHGLWVDPDVDTNLVWSDGPARRLAEQGARGVRRVAPVVRPQFDPTQCGAGALRRQLGLDEHRPVVLVVSGSWGAGAVQTTAAHLRAAGPWQVVVATGTNPKLRKTLERQGVKALGWTENMAELFAAVDVVVENAGGLTAMEVAAMGVPLVSYLPIPDHGRDNVAVMAEAGLCVYARSAAELCAAVTELTSGVGANAPSGWAHALRKAQERLFGGPPAEEVLLGLVADDRQAGAPERRRRRARRTEPESPTDWAERVS